MVGGSRFSVPYALNLQEEVNGVPVFHLFTLLFLSSVSPFMQIGFPYWGSRPVISHRHYDPVVSIGAGLAFQNDLILFGIKANLGRSLTAARQGKFSESSFHYGDMSCYLEYVLAHRGSVRVYGGLELGAHLYEETRRISLPDEARTTVIEAAKQGNLILEILYTQYRRPLGWTLEIPFVSDGETFNLPRAAWAFCVYLD